MYGRGWTCSLMTVQYTTLLIHWSIAAMWLVFHCSIRHNGFYIHNSPLQPFSQDYGLASYTCHDVIDVFRSTAIVFLEHFFRPIDTSLFFFWAIDKLWGIQRKQIFLTVKCSCNIECMLVPLMPKVVSTHDRSHDDYVISVGAQHQWFLEQQLILDDHHEIRLGVNYDLGWIQNTIDKRWSLMELHRQKLN